MMLLSFHHIARLRRLSKRLIFLLGIPFLLLDTLILTIQFASLPPYTPFAPFSSISNATVFIASIHHNTAAILATTWSDALVGLVEYLGPENVYVSAADDDSGDGTNFELLALKERLDERGVRNTFNFDTFDEDDGAHGLSEQVVGGRRTTAKTRNRVLKPLKNLARQGTTFDIVLWIADDIIFRMRDVAALLNTRGGHFSTACSMPAGNSPDILTLRDDQGHRPATSTWPWFYSSRSRLAALRNAPIPVLSCWEGLVAFDAAPFYTPPAIRFREIEKTLARHDLYASERCLIHADNHFAIEKGVWINPEVQIVTVDHKAAAKALERGRSAKLYAVWRNRVARWTGSFKLAFEERVVRSKLKSWEAEVLEGSLARNEPGWFCLRTKIEDQGL